MKRTALALTLILALLVSLLAGTLFVNLGKADPYIYSGEGTPPSDASLPKISIFSPENRTYVGNNIFLSFNVSVGNWWLSRIYYKFEWQQNETCVYKYYNPEPYNMMPLISEFSYQLNLTGLSEGKHEVSILVTEWGTYVGGIYSYDFHLSGSSYVTFITYTTPTVSFLSFENRTFETSTVPLNFTVDQPVSKVTYCLDGQANVTISGNTTLTGLPDGDHNVTVYATDEPGNTGASETMYFTILTSQNLSQQLAVTFRSFSNYYWCRSVVYFKKRKH